MTWVAAETVTASIGNTHWRDNFLETAVAKVTTAGDIVYATGANALARLGIGSAGQFAQVNAGATAPAWAWANYVLDRNVNMAALASSVTETTIYSFSVPGNTLGTNGMLRLTLLGDLLSNVGGTTNLTFRVKYGGVVAYVHALNQGSGSASRRNHRLEFHLAALNATNAQRSYGFNVGSGPGGSASPAADDGGGAIIHSSMNNGLAIDSTAAQTLLVSAQWDTNSASCSYQPMTAHLELLR